MYPLTVPSARALRLLATNHIFIEVTPDVFANNRLSSALDTGKHVEDLISKWALFFVQSPANWHTKLTLACDASSAPNRSDPAA
jgi:hypothetical protein